MCKLTLSLHQHLVSQKPMGKSGLLKNDELRLPHTTAPIQE